MLSTLEVELPRTQGPNPLFWTHTLAHLSLTPDHLQLTLPSAHPPFTFPSRTYCCLSCHLVLLPSPMADTAHCLECCVVASPGPPSSHLASPFCLPHPRSILYNYTACITKVVAKLFSPYHSPLRNSRWPIQSWFD